MAEIFFNRQAFKKPIRKATNRQVNLIRALYKELGQDCDLSEVEALSISEASDAISELLILKQDLGLN